MRNPFQRFIAVLILLVSLSMLSPSHAAAKPYDPFAGIEVTGYRICDAAETNVASFLDEREKEWTPEERTIVSDAMDRIFRKFPFLLPKRGPAIEICRVISAGSKARAATFGRRILIPDSFFLETSAIGNLTAFDILIHELLHAADCGYRFSLSNQWCDLVCPRIAKFHAICKMPKHCNQVDYRKADVIAKQCGLGGRYATENPAEAFAYLATDVLLNRLVDADIKQFIQATLAGISDTDTFAVEADRYAARVAQAMNALSDRKFWEAEVQYNKLLRERDNAATHIYLCYLYLNQCEYASALYHADRCIVLLQELGIPLECSLRKEARQCADAAEARLKEDLVFKAQR